MFSLTISNSGIMKGARTCSGGATESVFVVIFFVFVKLFFCIDVAMCDLVQDVESVLHLR